MAFITKKKNREGKYYVYLVEGYRVGDKVRHRTLKSYGSLEDLERNEPGAYERLRQEAKDGLLTEKELESLEINLDLLAPIASPDVSYGYKIIEDIYDHLGVSDVLSGTQKQKNKKASVLSEVLKLLVLQRILYPCSKLETFRSQEHLYGGSDVSLNQVYRSLESINEQKEALQLAAHRSICKHIGRSATLVFYDVTNYYFEIDMNDPDLSEEELDEDPEQQGLRKKGASKERRPKPIVQLGLFMDQNGIPISYRLFRGNQTDPITYIPAIEQVKKQFELSRIVVVADKAMNSQNNITETLRNGDGWLFSQKCRGKRGVPKDIQNFVLDRNDWLFNAEMTFAKKSMIRERPLKNKETVKEKVLVTWKKAYADREKIRRDGALDYARKLTNAELFRQTCKKGGKKYLSIKILDKETGEMLPFSPLISIDQEQVDYDAQFDGIQVLVTSEINMSDEEMMEAYRELNRIEDCFRVTKTEFEARPVYVWKPTHIQAHFLSCFLALIVIRILSFKTSGKFSEGKLIKAMNSAKTHPLEQGYYRVQASEDFKILLELLGIEWNKAYVKEEELNKFGRGWFTTNQKTS